MCDGVPEALFGELGRSDHGGATAGAVDMTVGTAKVEVDAGEAEVFERSCEFREVLWVLAPDLGDDGRVRGGDF